MPEYFRSPNSRLDRAQKHIADFKREMDAFFKDKPWTHAIEINPDGTLKEHKIKFLQPFPDAVALIASDAMHNLRSALDQCGTAAFRASGVQLNRSPKHYFPFGRTEEAMLSGAKGNSKDIPPYILSVMLSLQPYETGNPLLYALNRIRSIDTHDLFRPLAVIGSSVSVASKFTSNGPFFLKNGSRWVPENNEIVFAVSPASEPDPDYNFEIEMEIAFGEVEIVDGQPVFGVLANMLGIVRRAVALIEHHTKRLFPDAFL